MKKIVVAITGASGSIYAKRLLRHLANFMEERPEEKMEVALLLSKNAADVWRFELDEPMDFPQRFKIYALNDFTAPFASGSAKFKHMVIIPCSMGTLGRIAHGFSDDLITRAADVILKERRQLICVLRDTPYSLIHIENMLKLTQAGGIVLPASPSFYSRPTNFDSLADTVVSRVLDLLQIEMPTYRWGENE
jgi:4-hydroxy-3-polyprenylbenzoate decarboxylase